MSKNYIDEAQQHSISLLNSAIEAMNKGDSLGAEAFIHDALDRVWFVQEETVTPY